MNELDKEFARYRLWLDKQVMRVYGLPVELLGAERPDHTSYAQAKRQEEDFWTLLKLRSV